ncbi:MAG: SIMPL domain-containing protein, partial [Gammaproteobacteria bacterium]|nr:SIMPL domain-containing protein [Gammaproteobacteria bacterium]
TKDRDKLERKALWSAIALAREKAEIIAKSSGVKLGKVMYVKESGGLIRLESYAFKGRGVEADSAQGAFEPGEITLSATVSVRYSIK